MLINDAMNKTLTIEKSVQSVAFEVEVPLGRLFIEVQLNTASFVHVYAYNNVGVFIGEMTFHANKTRDVIVISGEAATLNALKYTPQSGRYTLFVMCLDKIGQYIVPFKLLLAVSTNYQQFLEVLSHNFLQDYSFFDKTYHTSIKNVNACYYKGDLHGHTTYSDGEQNPLEAVKTIESQCLDFMALTEHNRTAFGFVDSMALMIPSFELTLPKVHINFCGVIENCLIANDLITDDTFDEATIIKSFIDKYSMANVSLNHMFLDEWAYRSKKVDILWFNTIEIICDPTYPTAKFANDKALAFFDYLWQKGYLIFGVGGSDSHNKCDVFYSGATTPSIYGDPATYVYCSALSVKNLIASVKCGHSYIARNVVLNIEMGVYHPGDAIDCDFDYRVSVVGIKKPSCAQFIVNGTIVKEQVLTSEDNTIAFDTAIITQKTWWLRFSLYCESELIAFINPVYKGARHNKSAYLEMLIEDFEHDYSNTVR